MLSVEVILGWCNGPSWLHDNDDEVPFNLHQGLCTWTVLVTWPTHVQNGGFASVVGSTVRGLLVMVVDSSLTRGRRWDKRRTCRHQLLIDFLTCCPGASLTRSWRITTPRPRSLHVVPCLYLSRYSVFAECWVYVLQCSAETVMKFALGIPAE